jgi:inosine-uridine nucleoside N-ribohydrolase
MAAPHQVIIDTDPGLDDAVAILFALAAADELEVLGIVAVAGNLPLTETERNARRICALAGRPDLPVYAGCARPLLRPLATADRIHNDPRLERILPEPAIQLQTQHGADFLVETLRSAHAGTVTLCALGPLTNIAVALVKEPEIVGKLHELVVMGGACFELGNVTPAAEFNIHVDPHAAAIVVDSGIPVTMIPLDVTHRLVTTQARLAALQALPNRCGRAVGELLSAFERNRRVGFGERAKALHDPAVIGYLLRPKLYEGSVVNVAVETESRLTAGMTVVDWWGVTGRKPNVRFMNTVDADGFYDLLTERLARLP